MNIPALGELTQDKAFDNWLYSPTISINILGEQDCQFILEDYATDHQPEDFHQAINNFLGLTKNIFNSCENLIYQYYQDCIALRDDPDDENYIDIRSPKQIWQYIDFGEQPLVSRRPHGDQAVYISLECRCAWEEEHGLQIVFKHGQTINKIGPYDGHLTNSDAYADPSLENVIYVSHT